MEQYKGKIIIVGFPNELANQIRLLRYFQKIYIICLQLIS